jgi:hypothetical protein
MSAPAAHAMTDDLVRLVSLVADDLERRGYTGAGVIRRAARRRTSRKSRHPGHSASDAGGRASRLWRAIPASEALRAIKLSGRSAPGRPSEWANPGRSMATTARLPRRRSRCDGRPKGSRATAPAAAPRKFRERLHGVGLLAGLNLRTGIPRSGRAARLAPVPRSVTSIPHLVVSNRIRTSAEARTGRLPNAQFPDLAAPTSVVADNANEGEPKWERS